MPKHQTTFDWDDASCQAAARERRRLLTRLKVALKGRLLGGEHDPRSGVSGAVISAVLDGLHGWCVGSKEGWTDRTPQEICPAWSAGRVSRALSYLQSSAAWSCVSVDPFRSHGSPRNRRAICWSNLHAWCEELEANPVVRRTTRSRTRQPSTTPAERQGHPCGTIGSTPAERTGHPCGTIGSTPAERTGHPCGTQGSYNEDGPLDGPDGPPPWDRATDLPEAKGEGDENSQASPERGGDRCPSASPMILVRTANSKRINSASAAGVKAQTAHSPGDRALSATEPAGSEDRTQLELLLQERLGIEAPGVCLDIGLRSQTLEQLAETIRFAVSQEVEGVRAWPPGFVFHRVSRKPPAEQQRPSDGWVSKTPEWHHARIRASEQQRRELQQQRESCERQLAARRDQVEAHFGPLIDKLYRSSRELLLDGLLPGDLILPGERFSDRRVRNLFLIAAMMGRYSNSD